MHSAAMTGDVDLLDDLLRAGHSANVTNFRGTPPLHMAVEAGCVEAVRLLLECDADVNAMHESRQTTAAHVAVGAGCFSVLQVLLQYGADPDARNSWGDSVIKIAKKLKKKQQPGAQEVWDVLAGAGFVE